MDDDIVEAVRARREAIFARYGYDLDRLVADLRVRERASGREIVPLPPRSGADDSVTAPAKAG